MRITSCRLAKAVRSMTWPTWARRTAPATTPEAPDQSTPISSLKTEQAGSPVPNQRLRACPACGATVAESLTELHKQWHANLAADLAAPVDSGVPSVVDVGDWPEELA